MSIVKDFIYNYVFLKDFINIYIYTGLQIMVGPGHCPMISKYGPSLSKAVGPVDPSFLVVKKSHFNKNIHLTASLRTPQIRMYM